MEGRHSRMLGIMAMLGLLSAAFSAYTFVMFHYAHIWTLLLVCTLLFSSFMCPAICWGYDDSTALFRPDTISEESYLNRRDVGYGLGLVLYAQTYIIPAAAWYRSDGLSPSMGAVITTYFGNLCCALAFEIWARLFIWKS